MRGQLALEHPPQQQRGGGLVAQAQRGHGAHGAHVLPRPRAEATARLELAAARGQGGRQEELRPVWRTMMVHSSGAVRQGGPLWALAASLRCTRTTTAHALLCLLCPPTFLPSGSLATLSLVAAGPV